MAVILRDYQIAAVADIRNAYGQLRKTRPLLTLPTGGGKTRIFTHVAHGAAAKGNRVLILSHRTELIDQISEALKETETPHGFIAAGYPRTDDLTQIASVMTLIRRLDKITPPNLLIVDEAHHARSAVFEQILKQWPSAKILGVTATPIRLSGEGLGEIFDHLILGPSTAELIERGYLARYRLFSPPTVDTSGLHRRAGEFVNEEAEQLINKASITGSALAEYEQHARGLPALAFCISVRHATSVAEQFRSAGYSAVMLDGKMDRGLRRDVIRDFRAGKLQIITSCDVLSEGFDVPGAHAGIFLRPTQSVSLYLQQVGRVLRPCDGVPRKYLLDHVGNALRHGLPDEHRDWDLSYDEETQRRPKTAGVRICQRCFCALPVGTQRCPECRFEFPAKPREVEEREGTLVEVTAEERAQREQKRRDAYERSQATDLEKLIQFGRAKGVKGDVTRWAAHVLASRAQKKIAAEARRAERDRTRDGNLFTGGQT